jgi:hypothetical protein
MADRAALLRLRQDVHRDVGAAEALLEAVTRRLGADVPNDEVLLGYAAVTLHQAYTALETCFERICQTLEGSQPVGADSHQALLHNMTRALDDMRPAVLHAETAKQLQPLLRFRHFVRHAYAVAWDPKRIDEVLAAAQRVWPRVRADMDEFLAFLDEVIEVV